MSVVFQGQVVRSVGSTAKSALRDYLRTAIRAAGWQANAFDCLLVDQLESETPNGKPLLSIHTGRRSNKLRSDGTTRIAFIVELHVLADGGSGALVTDNNPVASDELLSDDAETVLRSREARTALEALGLSGVMVGERRETVSPTGLHRNITPVEFSVVVSEPTTGGR